MTVLPEDPCSVSRTYIISHNCLSRGFNIVFLPLWVPGTNMVHRHTCRHNTLMHKIKRNKFLKDISRVTFHETHSEASLLASSSPQCLPVGLPWSVDPPFQPPSPLLCGHGLHEILISSYDCVSLCPNLTLDSTQVILCEGPSPTSV